MSQRLKVEPDLEFIREVKSLGGDSLKKCYQCATCSVVCDLSPEENPFPRKEMIWAQWGFKDRLIADPDVWLCYNCGDCTVHCPRSAKPGEVLGAVRAAVIKGYSIPRFMGKLMASPKGLPVLLAIAVGIVFFLVWWTGVRKDLDSWGFSAPLPAAVEGGGYEGGYFGNFLEHGPVEMIFIGGNILVFTLLAVSMLRFWKDMKQAYGKETGGPSLVSCLIATVKDIVPHTDFRSCTTNKVRFFAHLCVFFGFFGAMATAGLAVLDMIVLGHQPPIPFFNPIKILGNTSFVLLIIGTVILMYRRIANAEQTGQSSYVDWVFLLSLFIVSLTGGLTQVGRQLAFEDPTFSYICYFIHIIFVFFLLWYMPYSKFAHMFYRTLGLAFAKSVGRERQKKAS
jgi:quinone-modifying oxidoreductase subunit QmoC